MEKKRLKEARENKRPWKKWGPYLSERQWGTVREDYSMNTISNDRSIEIQLLPFYCTCTWIDINVRTIEIPHCALYLIVRNFDANGRRCAFQYLESLGRPQAFVKHLEEANAKTS